MKRFFIGWAFIFGYFLLLVCLTLAALAWKGG